MSVYPVSPTRLQEEIIESIDSMNKWILRLLRSGTVWPVVGAHEGMAPVLSCLRMWTGSPHLTEQGQDADTGLWVLIAPLWAGLLCPSWGQPRSWAPSRKRGVSALVDSWESTSGSLWSEGSESSGPRVPPQGLLGCQTSPLWGWKPSASEPQLPHLSNGKVGCVMSIREST